MPGRDHLPIGRFFATFLMVGAVELTAGKTMAQTRCDYLRVAQEHIASRYPLFNAAGLKRIITESSELWQITFELPPGTLGGTPTVVIDKATCRVMRSMHDQ
jgi:hypothetical protein